MVTTNTQNKLPGIALTYLLVWRGIGTVILGGVGIFLIGLGSVSGTCTSGGVSQACTFPGYIPGILLIIIGILLPIYSILWYSSFSYILSDQSITINSGILFRESKTIDFVRVQNIDNTRGPLQMMSGITAVNIWTAAQDQIQYGSKGRVTVRPDGKLYLSVQDAADIKNFIQSKGAVQTVQMVPPAVPPVAGVM